MIYTLSPPCPSWPKGGKSMGLYATDGWDFLEVRHLCMLGKPLACIFERSDDVNKRKHFVHIQHAMQLAGYMMVYSQNVPVHELTHNLRTRWFGVWIRSKDGKMLPKLTARALVQWSSERYRFTLVYGDIGLLPANKRKFNEAQSRTQVLQRRCPDPRLPLPTLCASSGSQHNLHVSPLQARGPYTFLSNDKGNWSFISPFTFASLMGCTQQLDFPNDIELFYKLIGNAVTVPQAALLLAATFDLLIDEEIDPLKIALDIWDLRLTADNAVVFYHAERPQLVRNQSCANHIELMIRNLNGRLVAAHAVQFHEDKQAYTPVLPCDMPIDTIVNAASLPVHLKEYLTIFDEQKTNVSGLNWGNLRQRKYLLSFRGHRCATFDVTDIPDGEEGRVEISPTLPLPPRNP